MVDFNWYRLSDSPEDWRIRAERLRATIEANQYWYNVITLSAPRFASTEDASRVCLLLNKRMELTRRMERELAWLDAQLAASSLDAEAAAKRRKQAWADEKNPFLRYILVANAAALLALGPFRVTLEASGMGALMLVLAVMTLGLSVSTVVEHVYRSIREMIEARRLLRVAKRLPEEDLVPFVRAVRLRDYQRTVGYTGITDA